MGVKDAEITKTEFIKIVFTNIKPGEVFCLFLDEKQQYGLIQVFGKTKLGYNIRVFYNLVNEIDFNTINAIVNTKDFYYIKDFYKSDLLIGCVNRLGKFNVPEFVDVPKMTRYSQRKPNGNLCWHILEGGKYVKTYEKCEDELKTLSPEAVWGIQYIKRRWIDGFTLENWNELEDKWYREYLELYELEELKE